MVDCQFWEKNGMPKDLGPDTVPWLRPGLHGLLSQCKLAICCQIFPWHMWHTATNNQLELASYDNTSQSMLTMVTYGDTRQALMPHGGHISPTGHKDIWRYTASWGASILHHTMGCGGRRIMAPLMIYGKGCQYSAMAHSGDAYVASCAARHVWILKGWGKMTKQGGM